MKRGEAIARMRAAVQAGAVVVSGHAQRRLESRGLPRQDLFHAMEQPSLAVEQRGGTFAVAETYSWRCRGRGLSGRDIGWVAAIEADVVIVTAYDPEDEAAARRGLVRRLK